MVQKEHLDRVSHALSDPTRRSLLETLGRAPATVSELSEPFGISLTAVKKHLQVLEEAGPVTTEKLGRSRHCRLGTEEQDDAMAWITSYQRLGSAASTASTPTSRSREERTDEGTGHRRREAEGLVLDPRPGTGR